MKIDWVNALFGFYLIYLGLTIGKVKENE